MDWNIFEHLDWRWSPDSVALHELLVAVGDQVQIGYARVGSVKYYSENEHGQSGMAAERNARAAIEYKLKGGHGEEIAAAHSAINSYWPAVCPDCLVSLGCSG